MMRNATTILLFLAVGCAAPSGDESTADEGITGIGGITTQNPETSGAASGDGDGDDDSGEGGPGGPKLDVGSMDGVTAGGDGGFGAGCQKVDFLFVVDNSGSMADEQQNLTASFGGFVSAITDVADVDDFHIMVTDTDGAVLEDFTCGGIPQCCQAVCDSGSAATCDGAPCPGDACEFTGGAGRTVSGNGQSCGIQGDQRYIVSGQPDLADTFACLAEVGTRGNGDERQAEAVTLAVGPELNAADGCNAGFIRDDALLVITVITDEEDDPNDGSDMDPNSPGSPPAWVSSVIEAKKGTETAVVFLALVGDNDQPDGICDEIDPMAGSGAEPAPRLRELANSFTYGSTGSVCAPDYSPFFAEAVSVIDSACDEFEPVG